MCWAVRSARRAYTAVLRAYSYAPEVPVTHCAPISGPASFATVLDVGRTRRELRRPQERKRPLARPLLCSGLWSLSVSYVVVRSLVAYFGVVHR